MTKLHRLIGRGKGESTLRRILPEFIVRMSGYWGQLGNQRNYFWTFNIPNLNRYTNPNSGLQVLIRD